MRFTTPLAILTCLAWSAAALQPGDVPIEVAVRSDANGNIKHFYPRDEEAFLRKRSMQERQAKDLSKEPMSDTYAVQADANGNLSPFKGIGK